MSKKSIQTKPLDCRSTYTPKLNEVAANLAKQGYTNAQVADALGISEETFYTWRIKFPLFKDMHQAGKDFYDSEMVEKAMLEDSLGHDSIEVTYERDKTGEMVETKRNKKWNRNFQAQRMWLLNRHRDRWKDQSEVIHKDGDLETKLQLAEKRLKERKHGTTSAAGDGGRVEVEAPGRCEGGESPGPATDRGEPGLS